MSRAFLFGFLLIPVYVACSSDDFNPTPNGGATDAGTDSTVETGSGGSAGSGGTGGAGGDADAGPVKWPVHVEVVNHDTPGSTISVLSSMPDGGVDALTPLDSSGKMDVNVVDGGSVHLLIQSSTVVSGIVVVKRFVYSYYAISAESSVKRELESAVQNPEVGDITFYPDGTFPGGTSYVRVWPACSISNANSGNPYAGIPFPGLQACANATEYWAAALAFNAAGDAISAQLLEHLPVASSPTTIYISFGSPATYVTKKTTFAPLPADASSLGVSIGSSNPTGTAYGDQPFTVLFGKTATVAAANGNVAVAVVTKNIPEFVVTDLVSWTDGALMRSTRRSQIVTTLADTVWDPTGPARFESLSELDVTDVERPSVTWALETSGVVGECVETYGAWLVGESRTYWQAWQSASATGEVRFPALPDDATEFALTAGAIIDPVSATHFSPTTGDCLTYDQNQMDFATKASTGDP